MSGGNAGPFGRSYAFPAISECDDGTMCENASPCVPHPYKESKFVCDCSQAHLGSPGPMTGISEVRFAGVYCEHRATSYCQKNRDYSSHAFCANGGECRVMVGRNEEHAGCKCPKNYEGHYCQFVRGGRPSDWEMTDYMHPSLGMYGYGTTRGGGGTMSAGGIVGVVFLSLLACALAAGWMLMDRDVLRENAAKLRGRFARTEKEGDTADPPVVTSPQNAQFVGGKSVYKKKTSSSGPFVATTENLDADGGVLMAALGEDQVPSMEEVDLNDDPNVMVNSGKFA